MVLLKIYDYDGLVEEINMDNLHYIKYDGKLIYSHKDKQLKGG